MPRSVQSTTLATLPMRQPTARLSLAVSTHSSFTRQMHFITDSMCLERKRSAAEDVIPVKSDVIETVMANAEDGYCYMCQASNPEYMSTKYIKGIAPRPVCGLECEQAYIDREQERLKLTKTKKPAKQKVTRSKQYPTVMCSHII